MAVAPIMTEAFTEEPGPAKANPQGMGMLAAAMARVLADVGRVPKNGRNNFHGYDYAVEADIVDSVRDSLAANGLVLFPSVLDAQYDKVKEGKRDATLVTVEMEFTFVHTSGQNISMRWRGQGVDSADKAFYKAYTGALKHFLMKTFLISTGDDPEATNAHGESTRNAKPKASNSAPEKKPKPKPKVADLTDLLASAEGVTDDLRREWCAWLCKKVGVGKLAEIPAPQLAAFVGRLATMDDAERGARMRENLGIDDRDATAIAASAVLLIGECVDNPTAERYVEHLEKSMGIEALADAPLNSLRKLERSMAAADVKARGESIEAQLGEWDAARKAFFAEIDGALKTFTSAARTRLKNGYKAHVVGERPSLHAMSPEQIRGEADLLRGLGAEAAKHIEQHAVKPPASEVF